MLFYPLILASLLFSSHQTKVSDFKKMHLEELCYLKAKVEMTPDFPKPSVLFEDFFPILSDPSSLRVVLDLLESFYKDEKIDKIAALESRGFPLGCALADRLNVGFIPLRKKGKLPGKTLKAFYTKEYGIDEIHLKENSLYENDRVLIIDDLVATGGTLKAAISLIKQAHAIPIEAVCLLKVEKICEKNPLDIPLFVLLGDLDEHF